MDDEPKIPGTRVPDDPIHRASLWVESLKYAPDVRAAGEEDVERADDFSLRAFVEESGIPVTVDQLKWAIDFYGENMRRMIVGDRVNMLMMVHGGKGMIDLDGMFKSVWFDGFEHGAGTALGKRGWSNEEIRKGADQRPSEDKPPPLMQVIFDELAARGWTIDDGDFIDPEGNRWRSVDQAVFAQSMREIAAS